MRQIKRISFFLYSCLVFAGGFYAHIKWGEFFYPQTFGQKNTAYVGELKEEDVSAVVSSPDRITFQTKLVTVTYQVSTQETRRQEEAMPEKYVGMGREDFVRCMEDEAAAPSLLERKKGLFAVEVQSFSPAQVVVKKSYRSQDIARSFYLALLDNRVVVYEADKSTVYMQTFIDGRKLPQELRDSILRGWEVEDHVKLEAFLEEYTDLPAAE